MNFLSFVLIIFISLVFRLLIDFCLLFEGFGLTFYCIFENGEIVKISVSCTREIDFQGLAWSVFPYSLLFFGVWFLDGFGDGFFVIFGWILAPFWHSKTLKNMIKFGVDF